MLVYGDHSEQVDVRARLNEIEALLRSDWLTHDQLTGAFIDLAGIAQGIADAEFARSGLDELRPPETSLLAELTRLAGRLLGSRTNGCGGAAGVDLRLLPGASGQVEVRLGEGFAFYALYPEAYGLAARELRLQAPPRVIGLRSIGTGLACMAAAALGAPPPITLRPVGNPFARQVRISPALRDVLLDGDTHYVIVDEGPGLSGSSFGAIADWLEEQGVKEDRISFLPGHSGPLGPQASDRHQRRWSAAQRPVAALDEPSPSIIETLIGPIDQPLQDISGGAWRPLWSAAEVGWPAIDPLWERRKLLAHTAHGTWLVKFAGIGRIGESKLRLARTLESAGVGAAVAGLTHGWLVTRWHEDAVPTRPTRQELLAYLRLRSSLPAPGAGASLATLLTMIRRNLPDFADWSPAIAPAEPRPVCTDNRMAAHEWLRLRWGQLLKADALDHHAAHDLIGCQDIAWDLAGAATELDLDQPEVEQLRSALAIDPGLLAFCRLAYVAFRVGAHRMSAASLEHWPDEQRRHLAAAERLEHLLPPVDAVEHAGHVH